jgi:transglutaminase-like putative cysteine protease
MTGRRLRITHRTGYRYGSPVRASFNEVRMTPHDGDGQVLLSHELRVDPAGSVSSYVDYWGALVEAFDVHQPHEVLEVVATSTVDTAGSFQAPPGVRWQDLQAPGVVDRWGEFLATTSYVDDACHDGDRAHLVQVLAGCADPLEAVNAAVDSVHARLTYTPGVTTVSTTAHEAWASGHGVCQDFAHATLSLLRAVGVPARYVSGYLHSEDEAVGQQVHGESHAWVEAWLGEWQAFDPTNERTVGAAHVVVARGRDYADVPPFKGLYAGGQSEELGVSVEITALSR